MVLVEGLLLVRELVVVLPGLGDLRFVTMCVCGCGDGRASRVDGVGVDSFDAMSRAMAHGRRTATACSLAEQDAGTRTMIIAASGSDMADSFVSNWSTPSKFPSRSSHH